MTPQDLKQLSAPDGLSVPLQALWHEAKGDWERAHELAQAAGGTEGDRVHAYLHRREGDEANAAYWYRRAGRTLPALSLDEEWAALVTEFASRG